jgi:ADP-ribose pyrophosphatase YjhB (NUDIX family)
MKDELLRPYQRTALAMIRKRGDAVIAVHRSAPHPGAGSFPLPGGYDGGPLGKDAFRREAREEGWQPAVPPAGSR